METALSLDPENIVALRYLGDIARDTGDFSEAARWYTRTLEADPYSEAAQAGLDSLQPGDDSADGQLDGVTVEAAEQVPEPPADDPEPLEPESLEPESLEPESLEPQAADAEPLEREDIDSQSHEHPAEAVEFSVPEASMVDAPQPVDPVEPPEIAEPSADLADASTEFAGDLDVSAVTEPVEPRNEEVALPGIAPDSIEPDPIEPDPIEPDPIEPDPIEPDPIEPEPIAEAHVATEVVAEILTDVEAHREAGLIFTEEPLPAEDSLQAEEAIQTEERVLEAAAPFVTETMADLYMEQGYPHEALELMLQLSEQRPEDESLRVKIELIQSAILARRDAAIAAARAERSEASTAYPVEETRPTAGAADGHLADDGPFDPSVAEVDESDISVTPSDSAHDVVPAPEHETTRDPIETPSAAVVIPVASLSVREMFARMDGARPRGSPVVPPKPAPALRSDFVQMPKTQTPAGTGRKSDTGEHRTSGVPRSSGPHQTFDPSTADIDDFDAWLRGLRGP